MSRDRRWYPAVVCALTGAAAVAAARLPGTGPGGRPVLDAAGWLLLAGSAWAGRRGGSFRTSVALAGSILAVLVVVLPGADHRSVGWTTGCGLVVALGSTLGRKLLADREESALRHSLAEQASTDPLTGLGNRRALDAALAGRPGRARETLNFITLDLDNFKVVNTLLGHHVGDQLLERVAATIRSVCDRQGARPFRLGGDEFVVLAGGTEAQMLALGTHLIEQIDSSTHSFPAAARVNVSASAGVAGGTAAEALEVLAQSGEAMRAAKDAGRAQVMLYDRELARQHNRHVALERRLRRAIRLGAVDLAYQPIISLPEMRMVGVESLARWTDEELGPVGPDEFIPVAEDCGLIVELGLQMARRSMYAARVSGSLAAGLVGGCNVSPTQLRHPEFVTVLVELLCEMSLPSQQFVLEVTESVQIEADDPAVAALWRLSELGFPIAIDDFGTGYSSLSLISRLPARILKLDRSLTQQLHEPRGLAVARCVTEMARALDVDVVAEGIETVEQLHIVRSLGVGFGQGWLFSKAVSLERFSELVADPDQVLAHLPAELLAPSHP